MSTTQKSIFYTLFAIGAIFCFLYILFPSEDVERLIANRIRAFDPDYQFESAAIAPALPAGIKASAIKIRKQGAWEVPIDHIKLTPDWLTLTDDPPSFNFNGEIYGGNFKGSTAYVEPDDAKDHRSMQIKAIMTDMFLDRIGPLQQFPNNELSGQLSGTINCQGPPSNGRMEADLSIKAGRIDFKTPIMNLNQLTFTDVSAKLILEEGRRLEIEDMIFKGNDVNGTVSGDILIKNSFDNSRLNLKGTIKPHPSFISKVGGEMVSILFKRNAGQGGELPFKITGTVDKPSFSLQ